MKQLYTALALTLASFTVVAGGHSTEEPCAPEGDLQFICGPENAEDLYHLPGTPWLITSGEELHLLNIQTETWQPLEIHYPAKTAAVAAPYDACPAPLEEGKRYAHGINVRLQDNGVHELYVVNHVGREAVEVFDLDSNAAVPSVTWKGCIPLTATWFSNAITPLPNNGLAISVSFDKTDPDLMNKMVTGKDTGFALEWFPGKGLKRIANSELSSNNGIASSADGEWLYIAGSGTGSLTRVARTAENADEERVTIKLPSIEMPDNVHWSERGTLLIAGHAEPLQNASACTQSKDEVCDLDYTIVEVDPETMEVIQVVQGKGTKIFGAATSVIQVGDELWLGTLRGNRVAHMPIADK